MDTRYQDKGYSANLTERPFGAFLTIYQKGKIVGEVSVGYFTGGVKASLQVNVVRLHANEPLEVVE
jgi:hypothetical protein